MQVFADQSLPLPLPPSRSILAALLLAVLTVGVGAAKSFGSAYVRETNFSLVDVNGGDDKWLECEIVVEVRRDDGDAERKRPEYMDDLSVELVMGMETFRDRRSGFEFFRSDAQLVSLREGKHYIRFYLPYEIVKRDAMGREPHSFIVRLSRGGLELGEFISPSLARTNVKESFLSRVGKESAANEGILLPQNETPFLVMYPDSTPSFRGRGLVQEKN
ncbi:MAG: hypothetical protein AAGA66_09910 [Bacteroidota bacterium]